MTGSSFRAEFTSGEPLPCGSERRQQPGVALACERYGATLDAARLRNRFSGTVHQGAGLILPWRQGFTLSDDNSSCRRNTV